MATKKRRKKAAVNAAKFPVNSHDGWTLSWRIVVVRQHNDGREIPERVISALETILDYFAEGIIGRPLSFGSYRGQRESIIEIETVAGSDGITNEFFEHFKEMVRILLEQEKVFVTCAPMRVL